MHGHGRDRGRQESKRLQTAAAVTRSGIRRYPSELMDSLKRCVPQHESFRLQHEQARPPLAAAWLGHASVMLRLGERWVLTDPVFSHRIGVRLGPITMGVGRLAPPVDLDALPRPDLILVSHAHFDHLDKPTLKRLASRQTRVVTAARTRRLIPRGFGDVQEIGWDDELDLEGLVLRALRPAHWGARLAVDKHRGFNSYVIDARHERRRVLYAGDTAYTDAYKGVGGADLSIFGIGAYDPWIHAHANPEQVWEMHRMAGGRYLMPIHHSTFKLSDEPRHEPLQRLLAAAGKADASVVGRELGEVWSEAG